MSVTAWPDHTEALLRALPWPASAGIAALAARLGCDCETATRVIEALAAEGLIASRRGDLVLTAEGLELLA